ncbi:hypothetical protein O181_025700 [Austropuccinia psidii MF-1]|uniref:Uncharacterized protein n=1 Tax=Austropuccinia psidii MF-1 TaxID=1389203 RepID=A0A9Q3CN51_9BASI|nr:hypothetical protein [Austropuccinia psidii MF-1]
MNTTNCHMLRWQITIQEYRCRMTIIYKKRIIHTNEDGISRAYDPEVASRIPNHFMTKDRRRNFKFSQWAPVSGTPDTDNTGTEETETLIIGISSS